MAQRLLTILALFAVACGGTGAVDVCSDSTIENSCASVANGPCHDRHGNTCIICTGPHVSEGCIYDPLAPLDGGTATCVKDCTDCGSDCVAM